MHDDLLSSFALSLSRCLVFAFALCLFCACLLYLFFALLAFKILSLHINHFARTSGYHQKPIPSIPKYTPRVFFFFFFCVCFLAILLLWFLFLFYRNGLGLDTICLIHSLIRINVNYPYIRIDIYVLEFLIHTYI